MKKEQQVIDLVASSNPVVKDKAISHLTSKAIHTKLVEDEDTGFLHKVPNGKTTNVTIPKIIRRKMAKSSPNVTPDRTVVINHNPNSGSITINNGGNKMKELGEGDYKLERKNTPKQLREQQVKPKVRKKV